MDKRKGTATCSVSSDLLDDNLTQSFWEKKLKVTQSKSTASSDKQNEIATLTKRPTITRVERSSVLNKVKSFLPQLEAANRTVLQLNPESRDIEFTDNCSNVIEMDIAFVKDLENTALCNLLEGLPSDTSDSDSDTSNDTENIQPIWLIFSVKMVLQ